MLPLDASDNESESVNKQSRKCKHIRTKKLYHLILGFFPFLLTISTNTQRSRIESIRIKKEQKKKRRSKITTATGIQSTV